jgi:hypothetical protein
MFCSSLPQLKYRKVFNPSRLQKFGSLYQNLAVFPTCSVSLLSLVSQKDDACPHISRSLTFFLKLQPNASHVLFPTCATQIPENR